MKTDDNNFFREVILRICGSLDIEKALWNCFLYVRKILPADELILAVYKQNKGVIEIVASANANGGLQRMEKIPVPLCLRERLERQDIYPRVRMVKNNGSDGIMKLIAEKFSWPQSSFIVGRLIVEDRFVGSLIVRTDGEDRYTKSHEKLWSLLNEPAAIALANSQRYLELKKLKELLADDKKYFQDELRRDFCGEIVGAGFGLKQVMEMVVKVAPSLSPVLLYGETGTGKEMIANAIHKLSPRNNGPMITVNCGAIPESLIDSELFGHEQGAFTGAISQKRGKFERANGGTIFLDEISELPLNAQVRLLRVLQEKEIERVGGTYPIKVDIRIISATNRDLAKMMEEGTFRDDLFYRISVFPIQIPPLRERRADIPAMVEHFMRKKTREIGLHFVPKLVPGTMEKLIEYDWPGNVRELSNAVERALIMYRCKELTFEDILGPLARKEERSVPIVQTLDSIEAAHIRRIMERAGGRVEGKKGAAALLGIKPGTLRHKMKKLNIPFGRSAKGN